MNIAIMMTAIAATAVSACGSAGADKVAAGTPAQANSAAPATAANTTTPALAATPGKEPAMTDPSAPAPAVRRPRPGEPILPSPIQPPAEVDPPHRDPGDRVLPPAPPKAGWIRGSRTR